MKKQILILVGIAVAVIGVGLLLLISSTQNAVQPGQAVDSNSLIRSNNHMTGQVNAKATLIEFGDYQCPACARTHPVLKSVFDAYKDNPEVSFVFRHFPLRSIHPNAVPAARAAESAGAQGRYWEMHNILYERQDEWATQPSATEVFKKYAQELGLDVAKFEQGLQTGVYDEVISADEGDAYKLGLNSTPSFYFNGQKLDKNPSADELRQMIEQALSR